MPKTRCLAWRRQENETEIIAKLSRLTNASQRSTRASLGDGLELSEHAWGYTTPTAQSQRCNLSRKRRGSNSRNGRIISRKWLLHTTALVRPSREIRHCAALLMPVAPPIPRKP